ncbi:SDR family oxidoreductase [Streptomyces sp. NPDC093510]|uniref:SDR family oxidoreductase n=1 Tax=Streptomyces sp. NPDC093510 TaxID=3155199 RepID=UPI003414D411
MRAGTGRRPGPCRLLGDQVRGREVHHGGRTGPRAAPEHHGQCWGGRTDGGRRGRARPRDPQGPGRLAVLAAHGSPRRIAAAIAFLASPAASYVTGAVLDAHGGYNA